jgi:hypothetical protein
LPSILPSYLYTFIALLAVSSLLVFSFMAYVSAVRSASEIELLKNLMDRVAAKGTELVTLALTTDAEAESFMQMPTTIGSMQYWLQLRSNAESCWVEGGFGDTVTEGTDLRVYLPEETVASGIYVAGHGAAYLSCNFSAETPQLQLSNFSEM